MAGTELKTDSWQRWMMYSKDAYGRGRIFLTMEQKRAVEEGKTFAQRAYADVWARDAALVQRVRSFLGKNFYWHQRLAKQGADIEVVQTLQSMIRGESVVLISEQSGHGDAGPRSAAQPERLPTFRESLMTKHGMSYDAATVYIDWYNDMVDRVKAISANYANGAAASLADEVGDVREIPTALGDAQPFAYVPDALGGDVEELARSTNNPNYAAKMLGYDRDLFGDMVHVMKDDLDLRGDDNVIWHDSGDIEFRKKIIGNMHDYAF
jgi:hypothetical protein